MVISPFVRNPYNYDVDEASIDSGLFCSEPTMAQQQFKDEVDINVIVERFGLTGHLPTGAHMPQYGDFSGVVDYHSAMNSIRAADETFMLLPAAVRERFANDPQKLLEFCADISNRDEAIKLGLVVEPPRDPVQAPSPPGTPPAPPAPSPP